MKSNVHKSFYGEGRGEKVADQELSMKAMFYLWLSEGTKMPFCDQCAGLELLSLQMCLASAPMGPVYK
jgi:hypothetical protein